MPGFFFARRFNVLNRDAGDAHRRKEALGVMGFKTHASDLTAASVRLESSGSTEVSLDWDNPR